MKSVAFVIIDIVQPIFQPCRKFKCEIAADVNEIKENVQCNITFIFDDTFKIYMITFFKM